MATTTRTGTRDMTYDLISVIYHQLQGAETYQTYVQDAAETGDQEVATFFREAADRSLESANRAKELLGQRLGRSESRS
jgi:rubrerythrin